MATSAASPLLTLHISTQLRELSVPCDGQSRTGFVFSKSMQRPNPQPTHQLPLSLVQVSRLHTLHIRQCHKFRHTPQFRVVNHFSFNSLPKAHKLASSQHNSHSMLPKRFYLKDGLPACYRKHCAKLALSSATTSTARDAATNTPSTQSTQLRQHRHWRNMP